MVDISIITPIYYGSNFTMVYGRYINIDILTYTYYGYKPTDITRHLPGVNPAVLTTPPKKWIVPDPQK